MTDPDAPVSASSNFDAGNPDAADHEALGFDLRAASDRWLPRLAIAELVSVLVLFTNRGTVHLDLITSLLGPLHGFLYLATIACGFLSGSPRAAKLIAIVPVIGGVLATLIARRHRRGIETSSNGTFTTHDDN